MNKVTLFQGFTDRAHVLPFEMYDSTMLKSASQELHPEIARYIRNARPIPGKNILLIDALGAGEVWGDNVNGDYFPRRELMNEEDNAGYRSFMFNAYPYKHHQNESTGKDPKRRYGERVPLSVYHAPMDRVQLIAIVDSSPGRADDIVSQCDAGNYPDVSMACGVPYDQCSICGKIHRTRVDYCSHANNMLRHIMPDGQKVYLINHRPRFHDISFVLIGADRQAKVLKKIAKVVHQEPTRTEGYNLTALMNAISPGVVKNADIEKQVLLEDPKVEKIARTFINGKEAIAHIQTMMAAQQKEASLPPSTLELLARFPLQDICKTAHHLGMRITPEEFQYIALSQHGMHKDARAHFDMGNIFNPAVREQRTMPTGVFNEKIASILHLSMSERSYLMPYVAERLQKGATPCEMQKKASPITSLTWPALGGVFSALKGFIPADIAAVAKMGAAAVAPYITPAAQAAAYGMAWDIGQQIGAGIREDQDDWKWHNENDYDGAGFADAGLFDKTSSIAGWSAGIGSVPLIYLYSDHVQDRMADPYEAANTGGVAKLIGSHPGFASFLSLLALPKVVDSLSMDRAALKAISKG